MSYDNELKIALWKNNGTHPNAPIFKGDATINGTKYEVALWKNDSDHPKAPALKGDLQLPQSRPQAGGQPAFKAALPQEEDGNEDIPF
jgi:hypothetical protein